MLIRCQHCRTPTFEITTEGLLILKERHHGEWHTSTYRLAELQKEGTPPDGPEHTAKDTE